MGRSQIKLVWLSKAVKFLLVNEGAVFMYSVGQMGKKKFEIPVDDLDRPIEVHRHPRARRMTLRVSHTRRTVRLTVPRTVGKREANAFINQHMDWLKKQILDLPDSIPFHDGAIFPFRGQACQIEFHTDHLAPRKVVLTETETGPVLLVNNVDNDGERRVELWLRKQARKQLKEAAVYHGDNLQLAFQKITVRDQTTRWGSCSSNGTLSFSWRLIMAPDFVLNYVAAHEVAHLGEMNHSSRFWELVKHTMPEFDRARIWLRENGGELHCYGTRK